MLLGSGVVGNVALADAQTRQDIRLVLQITIDGLRADRLNRYLVVLVQANRTAVRSFTDFITHKNHVLRTWEGLRL